MIVSLNQSWNDGFVVQVDRLGPGSCQGLHLIDGAESHDPLTFDGHGLIDVSRGVGNDAPVVHADDPSVHQDGVGPAEFIHQGRAILRES